MPELKLKHIVSCSSEDPNHKAGNLLRPETYYKWKCKSGQEKRATVIIQLEQEGKITSVDIGNNGSAFIEVLVGRSSWEPDEEYKVLLVASSFMSPSESKGGTNINRVRLFGPDNLNKAVLDEKWDRIKIVCTQPYKMDTGYGLSFISLHSGTDQSDKEGIVSDKLALKKIGSFKLKDEPDSNISIGSFFQRKNESATLLHTGTKSIAAAARDAPTGLIKKENSATNTTVCKGAARNLHPVQDKNIGDSSATQLSRSKSDHSTPTPSRFVKMDHPSPALSDQPPLKKQKSDPIQSQPEPSRAKERKKERKQAPYHRILRGVIFAISGYQNPERGNLRDRAVAMGAEYRPDWGPGCTHLVCAFKNTPKFNQVKGKGKIVARQWIDGCHKQKQRLPLKGYRLDGGESSSSVSDSEDHGVCDSAKQGSSKAAKAMSADENSLDEKTAEDEKDESKAKSSSDCDTMDELERVRKEIEGDPYAGTTEEEDNTELGREVIKVKPSSSSTELPELPDFFGGKSFLLYGDFEEEERRLLVRYITAYDGHVEDYMGDTVSFVVTNEDWDANFDQALKDNPSLVFLRPLWIFKCHELGQLADKTQFLVHH